MFLKYEDTHKYFPFQDWSVLCIWDIFFIYMQVTGEHSNYITITSSINIWSSISTDWVTVSRIHKFMDNIVISKYSIWYMYVIRYCILNIFNFVDWLNSTYQTLYKNLCSMNIDKTTIFNSSQGIWITITKPFSLSTFIQFNIKHFQ